MENPSRVSLVCTVERVEVRTELTKIKLLQHKVERENEFGN